MGGSCADQAAGPALTAPEPGDTDAELGEEYPSGASRNQAATFARSSEDGASSNSCAANAGSSYALFIRAIL